MNDTSSLLSPGRCAHKPLPNRPLDTVYSPIPEVGYPASSGSGPVFCLLSTVYRPLTPGGGGGMLGAGFAMHFMRM